MPTVIDGNNLIGSSPEMSLGDPNARRRMVQLLQHYQRSRKGKLIVVFDGEPDPDLPGEKHSDRFAVVFPKFGQTADDEIKSILNRYHDHRNVLLVSSDRELKSFARSKGAKTMNSIEFYFHLKKISREIDAKAESSKRIHTTITSKEVDHWLKVFEDD